MHKTERRRIVTVSIFPVPTRTTPDWQALGAHVRANGAVHIAPESNAAAARAALHRVGVRLYVVRESEKIVAWRVAIAL